MLIILCSFIHQQVVAQEKVNLKTRTHTDAREKKHTEWITIDSYTMYKPTFLIKLDDKQLLLWSGRTKLSATSCATYFLNGSLRNLVVEFGLCFKQSTECKVFQISYMNWKVPRARYIATDTVDLKFLSPKRSSVPFSALTLLIGRKEGHPACKMLGVGLFVATIWLDLCTSYKLSCHHHFHYL